MAKKRPEKKPMPAIELKGSATKIVAIELSAEEHRRLRMAAAERGQTMKAYATTVLLQAIHSPRRPKGGD